MEIMVRSSGWWTSVSAAYDIFLATVMLLLPFATYAEPVADPGMTIRKAEQVVLHIPFANERVRRHMHRAGTHGERVLLYRLELQNGVVGWGESMLDHTGGSTLVGRNAAGVMADDRAGFGYQMAAIDAVGRSCGLPAWQLMGNKLRDRVGIAWWAIDMPPEDWAAELTEAAARGYTTAKVKGRPWRDIVAQMEAVGKAVPSNFTCVVDFNGFLLDAAQAQSVLSRLDGQRVVGGYESPFYLQTDTTGAVRLASALQKPTYEHFNETVLQARASDGFLVTANYGPLGMTRRQDALCASFNRPYWLQMVGTGLTTAFMAHLGATLSQATLPAVTCHELWEDDLLVKRIEVKDGTIAVPEGPGLGVEVDMAAIARYRVADIKVPTPKELFLAQPRTIRIRIPEAGAFGTGGTGPAQVLEFKAEKDYYEAFLKGKHPGFRAGTGMEVIEEL